MVQGCIFPRKAGKVFFVEFGIITYFTGEITEFLGGKVLKSELMLNDFFFT